MVSGEKREVEGVLVIKEKKTKSRKSTKKPTDPNAPPKKKKMTAKEREELLIENFVGLQRAMINLSIKFENLSDNISKLLNVFEISARDYMVNKGRTTPEVDRDLLNRINMLIDQNKNLLGSVRALEDKIKKQETPKNTPIPMQPISPPIQSNVPAGMQPSSYSPSATPSKPKTIVQTI
jgi:hypothetical protein